MRFLCASDFIHDPHSGAAGSILAGGSALARRGHRVDYLWHNERHPRLPHPSAYRLLELPRRQLAEVGRCLAGQTYDAVIISQPYAYLVYERLARSHPRTIFLNRTHGWEERCIRAADRFASDQSHVWLRRLGSPLVRRLTRRACARTAASCDGLITPSRRSAEFIVAAYGLHPEKVRVIPYGVPEGLAQSCRPAATGGGLRLLFVGNYLPIKGSRVLEAVLPELAAKYPDASLTFVTNREATDQLRACYGAAFGNRLTVHAWMAREELLRILATHDVLLFPSLFEGFGKAFLEAMACGLCVVGFDEGGLRDLARCGQEALYGPVGDEAVFKALLERCLATPALARAIGARASQVAREFTWDRHAAATEAFCVDLLARRRARAS